MEASQYAGAVHTVVDSDEASNTNLYVEARDSDSVGTAINTWLGEVFGRGISVDDETTLFGMIGAIGLQTKISRSFSIFGEAGLRLNPGFEIRTPTATFGIRTQF